MHPAPGPDTPRLRCALCGWHSYWCVGCQRKVTVAEICPAHQQEGAR